MKRNLLVLPIAFFGLVILIVIIYENLQKPKISNELSDRSKEFIKSRTAVGGVNQYAPLLEEDQENTRGKRMPVGSCFSIVMPFNLDNSRQEGECSGYFSFSRPKGSIVAFMEDAPSGSINDAPGLFMRRQNKEQYEERSLQIGQKTVVGFEDKNDIYTITTYQIVSGKYFVLTLKLPEKDDKKLIEVLSSVEFI